MTKKKDKSIKSAKDQISLFDSITISVSRSNIVNPSSDESTLTSLLALSGVKGIGLKTLQNLFDWGFLESYSKKSLNEKYYYWLIAHKLSEKIVQEIFSKRSGLLHQGREAADRLRKSNIRFITKYSSDFPESFFRLKEPPRWIFVKGNLEIINSSSLVALIGTREPSEEGKKLSYSCAKELAIRNFTVVSGLAKGIDTQSHWGAVDYFGQTIAIIGYGFDSKFAAPDNDLIEKIILNDGAIISEFLPDQYPSKDSFLRRNELIASISRLLIPVESPSLKSGTGSTIRRAREINTPIIGIIPQGNKVKSLALTQENLKQLGCEVFTVHKNSVAFWNFLHSIFPDHNWENNSKQRQDRFFRREIQSIEEAQKTLNFDKNDIERFITMLKVRLKK